MRFHTATALLALVCLSACDRGLPDPDSSAYTEAVRSFHTGLAAVQVAETAVARAAFRRVTELAPGEPAGWADLGLVSFLANQLDTAAVQLGRARELAPGDPTVHMAAGVVARARGDLDAAAGHFRRAAELSSEDPRPLFLLAQVVEEQGPVGSADEAATLVDRILRLVPGNTFAWTERARLAARAEDAAALDAALDSLAATASLSSSLSDRLEAVRAAAREGAFSRAGTELAFLRTELDQQPWYRRDRQALELSPSRSELLVDRFLRLPRPETRPAAADTSLRFEPDTLVVGAGPTGWVRALWLDEAAPLTMAASKPGSLWIGSDPETGRTLDVAGADTIPAALHAIDYDYDFRMDLAVAGPAGLRLFRNEGDALIDVTGDAFPDAKGSYAGVWALDLDMEGDMDLVAARAEGPPLVLRNRGDGRFEAMNEFLGVDALRDLEWADLDADGDPDVAALDAAGELHVYLNRRQGATRFERHSVPGPGSVRALAVADLDQDAIFELLLLDADGALTRLGRSDGGWEAASLGRWAGFTGSAPGATQLFVEDLDNNGQLDVLASAPGGSQLWLGTADGLVAHRSLELRVTDIADVSGEGRLDLIAVGSDGTAWWLNNTGDREYFAATLRPQAVRAAGDRRINSFGIGGEIEVRAGLLYQKRPIQSPGVHFGLGEWPQADVARIIWPNGTVQAEFNVSGESGALARQRLKGSCPWVFTYDGERMRFATDFLWRTALGLRINAQRGPAVIHSEDWIRIAGDRLRPRDGFYDIRITAELWESHFFDHVALMVVDHPADTEVLVDERFAAPPPPLRLHPTGPLRTLAGARDHEGRDVSGIVAALDELYLDDFERGPYQGLAEEHYVEVTLPTDAPRDVPLLLVASGWIYPTDSSINLAIDQGDHPVPRALRVEVPDGQGGWSTVRPDFGFPAGKKKTVLVDLDGIFPDPADRRLRLRTSMEIYWDRIAWAESRPDTPLEVRRLLPARAELRYRGFSEVRQESRTAPELPRYDRIASTAPIWRDLVGYHTRFGDVRPLTREVDDRYVIMNAGDELAFRFTAPPEPPAGWTRDFVLVGDGWVKDGDYNTGFSTTVRPLPYHGLADYTTPPGRLEDDPAYQRHPQDWRVYHTRYITPDRFHGALLPARHD